MSAPAPELAPSAGEFVGKVHYLPVRVYYEDTDFSGIVYHASWLRFFERGRSDFFRSIGIHHAQLAARPDPIAFAILAMQVQWHEAARIDDSLLIETSFHMLRGARVFGRQRALRAGKLMCSAQVEACVIALNGRAKRPPRDIQDALQNALCEQDDFSA